MLMRKASLTQERRERLIAALLSCTSTNTVSLMGTHGGQGTITLDPRQRLRNENKRPYPRRYRSTLAPGHEWADTDSVDDETDVNSADLQGCVRSEQDGAVSWN